MEIEFHRLDERYEGLRRRERGQEKRLLGSLAQHGQQTPVVVIGIEGERYALVDGYKRVRALKKLKADTVQATVWDMGEAEALVLEQLMRNAPGAGPLEQAGLLRELHERFELSQAELARRFDRSQSWVSRLLSLSRELPQEIQEQVRAGVIVAHAAVKYLAPMARAKRSDALKLVAGLGAERASTRQMGELYKAWLHGDQKSRALLLKSPWTFLKAREELQRAKQEPSLAHVLLEDLGALGGIARRVSKRLREGQARELAKEKREELARCVKQASADTQALFALADKELCDA